VRVFCALLSLFSRVFLEQKRVHTFAFFRVSLLKQKPSLSLFVSKTRNTSQTKTHSRIYKYIKKMSYNFGNDGATQFQGGGYGYAFRVYVLSSRPFFSLSLDDILDASSKERFWGKKF